MSVPSVVCLAFLVALGWAVRTARAGDWYVHGDLGDDAWTGTDPAVAGPDGPKQTLGGLGGALREGDTVWVAGTIRNGPSRPFFWIGVNDVTVRQWPGQAQAVVRGDVVVPPGGWSAVTTTSDPRDYRVTIGPGLTLGTVTWNWDTSMDALGLRRAHLAPAPALSAVASMAYSYYYDAAGGVLTINAGGGNPAVNTVTYVPLPESSDATLGGSNGVYVQDSRGAVIDGLHFALFTGKLTSTKWYQNGVQFYSCTGSVVRNCTFWDNGIHSVSMAGLVCADNRIENCRAYGLMSRSGTAADGGSHYVFYAGGSDVTGCLGLNNTAVCSPVLRPDGAAVAPAAHAGGYLAHTNGVVNLVRDVEWRGCTLRTTALRCEPTFVAADQAPPGDPADPRSYALRVVECEITGPKCPISTTVAFIRCRFDMTSTPADPNYSPLNTPQGEGDAVYFEACDLTGRLGSVSYHTLLQVSDGWTARLVNCSLLLDGDRERGFISYNNGGSTVIARNCVFAANSAAGWARLCGSDAARPAAAHDFKNCSYFNIDEWSVNPALGSLAQWLERCDTAARAKPPWIPPALPFADPDGPSLGLTAASSVRTLARPYGPVIPRGINGVRRNGQIGSWQYPLRANMVDGVPRE